MTDVIFPHDAPFSEQTGQKAGSAPDSNLGLLIRSDEDLLKNSQKSRRHSALVRKMRLILPVVALGIVAVLMTWKDDQVPLAPVPREKVSPQTVSQSELINPKFQSEDTNAQPYTITADKATQNAADMDTILLQKPVADMTLKSGDTVSLKAVNGSYKQGAKTLDLNGQVEVHHNSGYVITTEKMNIDVTNQTIESQTPVTGHGPAADITATGLSVDGAAHTVIFKGPATLTLRKVPSSSSTDIKDKKDPQP